MHTAKDRDSVGSSPTEGTREWRNGSRTGLKIQGLKYGVRVRIPPPAFRETDKAKAHETGWWDASGYL